MPLQVHLQINIDLIQFHLTVFSKTFVDISLYEDSVQFVNKEGQSEVSTVYVVNNVLL